MKREYRQFFAYLHK